MNKLPSEVDLMLPILKAMKNQVDLLLTRRENYYKRIR